MKRLIGICVKKELRVEFFDLNNPAIVRRLIDMGFVLKVREKVR